MAWIRDHPGNRLRDTETGVTPKQVLAAPMWVFGAPDADGLGSTDRRLCVGLRIRRANEGKGCGTPLMMWGQGEARNSPQSGPSSRRPCIETRDSTRIRQSCEPTGAPRSRSILSCGVCSGHDCRRLPSLAAVSPNGYNNPRLRLAKAESVSAMADWKKVIQKIDDYRWRIPKSYKSGMRTDGHHLHHGEHAGTSWTSRSSRWPTSRSCRG